MSPCLACSTPCKASRSGAVSGHQMCRPGSPNPGRSCSGTSPRSRAAGSCAVVLAQPRIRIGAVPASASASDPTSRLDTEESYLMSATAAAGYPSARLLAGGGRAWHRRQLLQLRLAAHHQEVTRHAGRAHVAGGGEHAATGQTGVSRGVAAAIELRAVLTPGYRGHRATGSAGPATAGAARPPVRAPPATPAAGRIAAIAAARPAARIV